MLVMQFILGDGNEIRGIVGVWFSEERYTDELCRFNTG